MHHRPVKNSQLALALAGSAILLLTGCSTNIKYDSDAPTGPPSAQITLKAAHAAYWASGGGGSGILNYKGQNHNFCFGGAGFGGTGAQHITATGDVYNLNKLSDFAGTYTGMRTGITVIGGKIRSKMKNEHGVVAYITGKSYGLASATGASTVVVKLE